RRCFHATPPKIEQKYSLKNGSGLNKKWNCTLPKKEIGMGGCRPTNTPIDPNKKLKDGKVDDLMDIGHYQRLMSKLIYLSHTRLDIVFVKIYFFPMKNILI
ncbi:hypothetical protein CR513_00326, partial [Mucuna pruriens]